MYIFAADSVGLFGSMFITFLAIIFKVEPSESKSASRKTEFDMK